MGSLPERNDRSPRYCKQMKHLSCCCRMSPHHSNKSCHKLATCSLTTHYALLSPDQTPLHDRYLQALLEHHAPLFLLSFPPAGPWEALVPPAHSSPPLLPYLFISHLRFLSS